MTMLVMHARVQRARTCRLKRPLSAEQLNSRLGFVDVLPSGKHTKNHGTSQFLMGKSAINWVMFNSYFSLTEGIICNTALYILGNQ